MPDMSSLARRAVIDASIEPVDLDIISPKDSAYLLPCVDRPFLQHVIEYMVRQHITRIELLVGQYGRDLKSFFGDGTRWGIDIQYHLLSDDVFALSRLKALTFDPMEKILLARGDAMPVMNMPEKVETLPLYLADQEDAEGPWTGWALLDGSQLNDLAACQDAATAECKLKSVASASDLHRLTTPMLKLTNPISYLHLNEMALRGQAGDILIGGRTGDEGVWIGRNVVVHPTAKVVPPVYVGENCRIGKNVTLGPATVVGENSLLDEKSIIHHSIIFPYSYVGEFLEVEDAVVDKNRLVNTRQGAALEVEDDFILGSMLDRMGTSRWDGLAQTFWASLLIPLYLLQKCVHVVKALVGRPVTWTTLRVLRPPLGSNLERWHEIELKYLKSDKPKTSRSYFIQCVIPNIGNVLRGRIQLIGCPMRSRDEMLTMEFDRQKLYSSSRPGLIDEIRLLYGEVCIDDLAYATEVVYSVSHTIFYDLRLLLKFIKNIFINNKD